jgi:hypothetical protein
VDYLFASRHKGPRFKSPGGYLCETGILLLALSCYNLLKYWDNISKCSEIAGDCPWDVCIKGLKKCGMHNHWDVKYRSNQPGTYNHCNLDSIVQFFAKKRTNYDIL